MARSNLVKLPYDVRIKIFQDYFRVEGGYVFSSESEKLTTADGQLIVLTVSRPRLDIDGYTESMNQPPVYEHLPAEEYHNS
ncbi:hypothetical protein FOPG_13036 [Fusarium oxysporum f. sp. conglutinans race 2 54008]|uniref:Uncharacterized protein n=2 Tax=Fusarium oxysporum f. sp. conglutinans TaxID=100902 RepID=F9FTP8_FUSOF|nr:hypothetical protein FOXB_09779 [Fusarium oxysporum f. sp. conglutinans Fo5176]EXL71219.1 hypothetical protein FOPG_13036 [Fusarium oxysporum f. sp. conglutinans race 2 54008]